MSDEKPPEKPTVEMEKVPPWAVRVTEGVAAIRADVGLLTSEFHTLRIDVRTLQQWRIDEERRRDEAVSGHPPPMTSARVREVVASTPSEIDLANEAKIADVIVWRQNVDQRLAEVATKEDLKAQTSEFAVLLKMAAATPLGKKILYAAGVLLMAVLTLATTYLQSRTHTAPTTVQP